MPRILFSTFPALYFGGVEITPRRAERENLAVAICRWCLRRIIRRRKKNATTTAALLSNRLAGHSAENLARKKKKGHPPLVDYIFPLPEWAALVRRTQEDTLFSSLFSKQWTVTLYPSLLLRPSLCSFAPFLVVTPPLARCLATSEGVQ